MDPSPSWNLWFVITMLSRATNQHIPQQAQGFLQGILQQFHHIAAAVTVLQGHGEGWENRPH